MSVLRFDIFELDLGRRLLLRGGSAVHVSPKALRLLEILIEQRPNALAKQDLHDKVWPETFVSEATLASLIAELHPNRLAYGYSFCAEVSTIDQEAGPRGSLPGFVEWNGRQTALSEGENVIGRDPAAAVFIDDATVSRHHARLTIAAERVMLEDLGSKNGTFVLGKQIETVDLEDGSEFCVGGVTLVFHRNLSTITFDRLEPNDRRAAWRLRQTCNIVRPEHAVEMLTMVKRVDAQVSMIELFLDSPMPMLK